MTAWGVVAVCAAGGGVAGPFLERAARRVPVPGPPAPAATPGITVTPSGPAAAVTVTAVLAAACALAAVRVGAVPALAADCALFGGLVAMSVVDLRTGLVPRRLLYPTLGLVAAGFVAASVESGEWHHLLDAAIGAASAFAVFYGVWWLFPRGMGFGDVRLAGLCGLALGYVGFPPVYVGFLAAFFFGAAGGLVALALRGTRRFPFAPALAAGTAFGVLWGGWLGNLWLHPG